MTDTAFYGGTNGGNLGGVEAVPALLGQDRTAATRHHRPDAGGLVPSERIAAGWHRPEA
ncbi:hypothetical protein GCM10011504_10860 [Siccirubricoccus deserti]|uniref:Uncharacterized protein n=1 Tax=Siccirubricoccus deserti TaxID=2013562 RepID=A0A9X0QXG8_9PROT|nr:hypothetical protein [Siccirubricoccus deserti]MBC4014703.1 hypothetical protein [Siccirubricoccus deserti]GGC34336.1 hypothetical protein GCM10011504_10860 [Siccirubricoccus deserti]